MENTNFVITGDKISFSNFTTSSEETGVPCCISSSPNYNYKAMVDEILEIIDSYGFTTDTPINQDELETELTDVIWSWVEGNNRHEC